MFFRLPWWLCALLRLVADHHQRVVLHMLSRKAPRLELGKVVLGHQGRDALLQRFDVMRVEGVANGGHDVRFALVVAAGDDAVELLGLGHEARAPLLVHLEEGARVGRHLARDVCPRGRRSRATSTAAAA